MAGGYELDLEDLESLVIGRSLGRPIPVVIVEGGRTILNGLIESVSLLGLVVGRYLCPGHVDLAIEGSEWV